MNLTLQIDSAVAQAGIGAAALLAVVWIVYVVNAASPLFPRRHQEPER